MGLNGTSRPDIIGIGKNGASKIVEVVNDKQSINNIVNKTEIMVAQNPGLTEGIVLWSKAVSILLGIGKQT